MASTIQLDLRCARSLSDFGPSAAPGETPIALRRACSAQARGGRRLPPVRRMHLTPGRPFDPCVSPMATRPTHALDPWPPARCMRRTHIGGATLGGATPGRATLAGPRWLEC